LTSDHPTGNENPAGPVRDAGPPLAPIRRGARPLDQDKLQIELPSIPLHISSEEEILDNAQVVVHLANSRILRGRLQHFVAAQELIIILHDSDLSPIEIPVENVRYVLFRKHLNTSGDTDLFASRKDNVLIPHTVQPYQVVFKDNARLRGKTFTSLVDIAGLHFFQVADKAHFVRIFIPFQSVKTYHIGPLLGEQLVKEKALRNDQVDEAVDEQHSLRGKKIAEYIRTRAALRADELKKALDQQSSYVLSGEKEIPKIGEMLIEEKLITEEQLNDALQEQRRDRSKKLGQILVEEHAISTETLHVALAHKLAIPFVKLRDFDFAPNIFHYLPVDIARKYLLVPLFLYKDHLVVAMEDPSNIETIDVLRFVTGRSLELTIATKEDIEWAIDHYYSVEEDIEEDLTAAEEEIAGSDDQQKNDKDFKEILRLGKEKPIVHLVNSIIIDAIRRRASDIHIRPQEQRVDLLLRVDGNLIKTRTFSKGLLPAISSRIKIIGRMNIAERRLPQDGQARISDRGEVVDLRISIMPTVYGESVVIRLLNTHVGLKSISELGFNMRDEEKFLEILHKSNGIFLVTGPTGSGKSTTLYAALQEVLGLNVNIITVEDPVEYHIDGIEQIQIKSHIGYTFATALRHILRHDPDVIMLGEIRDKETAKISVESALTGHLVLSTLHTNSAATTVARLIEMGVEAYLLAPTLLGALAQRLVKRNCPHCMDVEEVAPHIRKTLNIGDEEVFYRGTGCENCNQTGFSGRIAVYELLANTTSLRALIEAQVPTDQIFQQAVEDGMQPLTENALSLARQRRTSLSEVYRVRLE
jgi:type IV pilus assembly protein PilB